jgi:hypothetical protein
VLPDRDLGIAVKPNCRNVVRSEKDIDRSFGCPTIRTDIPMKDFKSVADYQVSKHLNHILNNQFNYRTMETNQKQLIYYSLHAILNSELKKPISKDQEIEIK